MQSIYTIATEIVETTVKKLQKMVLQYLEINSTASRRQRSEQRMPQLRETDQSLYQLQDMGQAVPQSKEIGQSVFYMQGIDQRAPELQKFDQPLSQS